MSVKTSQNKHESLQERGDLADLFASALVLIRGNKRSESQRKNLRHALQLFHENRLGTVMNAAEAKLFLESSSPAPFVIEWEGEQIALLFKNRLDQLGLSTRESIAACSEWQLKREFKKVNPSGWWKDFNTLMLIAGKWGLQLRTPKLEELLELTIGELDLTVRTFNVLQNAQIVQVKQLIEMSEAELVNLPNFGRISTLNEVKEVLTKLGLHLKPNQIS